MTVFLRHSAQYIERCSPPARLLQKQTQTLPLTLYESILGIDPPFLAIMSVHKDNIVDENFNQEDEQQVESIMRLTGFAIADLAVLTKLDLPNCGMSSLPSSLPQLVPNLSILFLPKNRFLEMPAIVGACPNLQVSTLCHNLGISFLEGFPE